MNIGLPIGMTKKTPIDPAMIAQATGQTRTKGPGLLQRAGAAIASIFTGKGGSGGDWFGPQEPMPVTAPDDVSVRQFDYPAGFNFQVRPRGYEAITFAELRALSTTCDLVRLAIETRKDQISRLKWKIQPKREEGETGAKLAARTKSDPRIKAIEAFFQKPDGRWRFEQWMRQIVEDVLVCDAVTIYPRRTITGGPYTLDVIDPATIAIKIGEDGRLPEYPAPAYQQVLHGAVAKDLTTRDLVYEIRNPRTGKNYGYSPVEQVIITVNTAIRRALMQLGFYTEGTMPEAIIAVPPDWNPDQIVQFQTYWDALLSGNVVNRSKTIFAPTKDVVFTKKDDLKNDYDEWLARVIMFAFSLPATPFIKQLNRSTSETSQAQSEDEGLVPLMVYTTSLVNGLLSDLFAAPDLEFAWMQEDEIDQAKQAEIDKTHIASGLRGIDEIRQDRGWDPIGVPAGYPTATGYVLLPTPENQAALDAEREAKTAALQATAMARQQPGSRAETNSGGPGAVGKGNASVYRDEALWAIVERLAGLEKRVGA